MVQSWPLCLGAVDSPAAAGSDTSQGAAGLVELGRGAAMSMTPERKEENELKKDDRVVMHTCIESEEHPGKIWTCKTDQFTRGK
jgi:hypothetical protein